MIRAYSTKVIMGEHGRGYRRESFFRKQNWQAGNIGERQHILGQRFTYILVVTHMKEYISHQEDPPSLMPTHTQTCIFVIYLFILERGEGREKDRERNINVWLPLECPALGTWPATQACALTGNWTGDPLVYRPAVNPLSYSSQGTNIHFNDTKILQSPTYLYYEQCSLIFYILLFLFLHIGGINRLYFQFKYINLM